VEQGLDLEARDLKLMSPLHIACMVGDAPIVKLLVEEARCEVLPRDDADRTPLHIAVSEGNTASALQLIDSSSNRGEDFQAIINYVDLSGRGSLHLAAASGQDCLLKGLCDRGADIDACDALGVSPLRLASGSGHLGCVQELLSAGATVNAQDIQRTAVFQGQTALQLAVENGHEEIAQLLLAHAAHVEARDMCGRSAFHIAAAMGQTSMLRLLIDSGAQINAADGDGSTPLRLAVENGHAETASVLVGAGAATDAKDHRGRTVIHWVAEVGIAKMVYILAAAGADINIEDGEGYVSPLHLAAAHGHEAACQALIDCGANVNARDVSRVTPLHTAVLNKRELVFRLLVAAGASVRDLDSAGATILHMASSVGHLAIAKLAIQAGTPVNVVDSKGCTALHYAAQNGHPLVLNFLCSNNAAVDTAMDVTAQAALHLAAANGHEPCVRALIKAGAYFFARDSNGLNVFLTAAKHGHIGILNFLLTAAGDQIKDLTDDAGRSALFWAVSEGHVDTCKELLALGSDLECRDKTGCSCLHIAVEHGHNKVVEFLLEAGVDPTVIDKQYAVAPLAIAAAVGNLRILQVLAPHVDVNAQDGRGRTALHWAAENGHLQCVEFLLSVGASKSIADDAQDQPKGVAKTQRITRLLL